MITSRRSAPSTQVPHGSRFRRDARERRSPTGEGPALVWAGTDGRARAPIPVGWSRIGRSPTADIHLDDPAVSRRHALLINQPGHNLHVIDDRSLSGVYLNGRRVRWAELGNGDELRLGDTTLIVVGAPVERHSTI